MVGFAVDWVLQKEYEDKDLVDNEEKVEQKKYQQHMGKKEQTMLCEKNSSTGLVLARAHEKEVMAEVEVRKQENTHKELHNPEVRQQRQMCTHYCQGCCYCYSLYAEKETFLKKKNMNKMRRKDCLHKKS